MRSALVGHFFMGFFAKVTAFDERVVEGVASTEAVDGQAGVWEGLAYEGDLVELGAVSEALDGYLEWGNVREMHAASAVGVVLAAWVGEGALRLRARIVDDGAWRKVVEGVYKGFSIGGRVIRAVVERLPDGRVVRRILKLVLTEISLVDRPANPDARILLWKLEDADMKMVVKGDVSVDRIVALIQGARNRAELEGDLPGAGLYTQAIALILQASEGAVAEGAGDGADVPAGEEGEPLVLMGKAGRTLSGSNLAAMHKVLRALIDLMAGAGDEVASRLQMAYGQQGGGDLGKVAVGALAPQFERLAGLLQGVNERLRVLEEQPAGGGPVLRAAEKRLAGAGEKREWQDVYKAARIVELRRLATTEPNLVLRAGYQQELAALTA